MPLNFPSAPSTNDTYSFNSKNWIFNGTAWELDSSTFNPGTLLNVITRTTSVAITLQNRTFTVQGRSSNVSISVA